VIKYNKIPEGHPAKFKHFLEQTSHFKNLKIHFDTVQQMSDEQVLEGKGTFSNSKIKSLDVGIRRFYF